MDAMGIRAQYRCRLTIGSVRSSGTAIKLSARMTNPGMPGDEGIGIVGEETSLDLDY